MSIFEYLFGIFFLFPDIYSFSRLKYNLFDTLSLNQLSFYLLFRLPVFIINIFLLLRIKDFFKKYYQALLILILSCILPLPLLGRGYWGVINFLPAIILSFSMYLIRNKNFYLNIAYKKKKFFFYIYLFIIFIYLIAIDLKKINYNFNWVDNVIHSRNNFFLNINRIDFSRSDFEAIKDMYLFIYRSGGKINDIYIIDNKSSVIMALLAQAPVNGINFGVSSGDKYFDWHAKLFDQNTTNLELIVNDFKVKSAKYVLYNKADYLIFKNFFPKDLLNNYSVKYSNNDYVLLQNLKNN
jgi:hypothetical protein